MSEEVVIRKAEFNPNVKTYWLLTGIFVCIVSVVGIFFLPIWVALGLVFTSRYLARLDCILTEKTLKVGKGLLWHYP